jgi:hypothetical protein
MPPLLPGLLSALLLALLLLLLVMVLAGGCRAMRALMVMLPASVNFTALLTRLFST